MAKLDDIAAAALKKHDNNPEKALKDFTFAVKAAKIDLALEYLRAKSKDAGLTMEALKPTEATSDPRPASSKPGSIKVREHDVRQHRRRTHEEKEADRMAAMHSVDAVYDLRIEGRSLGSKPLLNQRPWRLI
jgi:hypothetical protein